jgi:hypothetical protein
MKTDELIDLLSTGIEPIDTQRVTRTLWMAVIAGLILAVLTCIVTRGIRPDMGDPGVLGFVLIKIAFGVAVTVVGAHFLLRHARPGGEDSAWLFLAGAPFAVLIAIAGATLLSAPVSHWGHLLMGQRWLACLLTIPLIALVPFAVIIGAIRMAAPTNLLRTGALAGLVAGGISAAAYAFHCPDDSLPFVALWYGGTIGFCTFGGAALGPRLLHW